jgi:hypothetical protein
MAADWRSYCSASDLTIEGDSVLVHLPGDRAHRVSIHDEQDVYRLTSIIVRPAVIAQMEAFPLHVWERNRGTELVGFKIDTRRRLIGEAWIPKAGLTAPEFATFLHAVAAECDRFEYQLTGSDSSQMLTTSGPDSWRRVSDQKFLREIEDGENSQI